MGSYEIEAAKSYRNRAEQLRAIAERDTVEQTRKALLQVAIEYEDMATTMEVLARRSRTSNSAASESAEFCVP